MSSSLAAATFQAADPDFAGRVRESFMRQSLMRTIGAKLSNVSAGAVEIELAFRDDLTQQHGFLHGGIIAALADNACGYAALTLTPAGTAVLTVEYKVNLLSPATGERMIARGYVTKPGQTLTVCTGEVYAISEGKPKQVAVMLSTIMTLRERGPLTG